MTQVKGYDALFKEINKRIYISVENVAKIVCDKLREYIDEQYYHDPEFYPNIYKRTFAFLNSTVYEMFDRNSAKVGIDTSTMHYKNDFSGRQVVEYALESMHGSPLYKTTTKDFGSAFIEWADENVTLLLKSELRKQGLNVV